MAQSQSEALAHLRQPGLVPVWYHDDLALTQRLIHLCAEAGLRAFEFTNRGASAAAHFSQLRAHVDQHGFDVALGIGTVYDAATAEQFLDMGADFVVAPIVSAEVAAACAARDVLFIPGAGTLTEIVTAERQGARLVKVFPAEVLTPRFIYHVRGPRPGVQLMPTGGVAATPDSLRAWFGAGAVCVGLGSNLFGPVGPDTDLAPVAARLRELVALAREIQP